jgi:lipopolysaccharide export system permease protein
MRLVDRYIARRVFRGYALIMVILASGFSLIALVHELDKVGRGTYETSDAALYVLLTLPGWMVELSPAMALLGAIVGLGELAAGQELTAMQALGVSRARIAWSVLKTGLLLMLAVMGLQEFVAPKLDQLAFARRTQAISGVESMSTRRGFWSRNGQRVVHVRRVLYGRILRNRNLSVRRQRTASFRGMGEAGRYSGLKAVGASRRASANHYGKQDLY